MLIRMFRTRFTVQFFRALKRYLAKYLRFEILMNCMSFLIFIFSSYFLFFFNHQAPIGPPWLLNSRKFEKVSSFTHYILKLNGKVTHFLIYN